MKFMKSFISIPKLISLSNQNLHTKLMKEAVKNFQKNLNSKELEIEYIPYSSEPMEQR
jgi:peptidase E